MALLAAYPIAEAANLQNSLFISLLAGNRGVETGSTVAASATNFVLFRGVREQMFAFDSGHSLANRWPRRDSVHAAFRVKIQSPQL
jgi:hypothetical protein